MMDKERKLNEQLQWMRVCYKPKASEWGSGLIHAKHEPDYTINKIIYKHIYDTI